MAISPVFSIARDALLANEAALGVVGGNIANVDTEGYTRQRAELVANPPASGGPSGNGVHVASVAQVLDPLLARRLLAAETDRGESNAQRDQLSALSNLLNDLDSPSLSSAVGGFLDAADALARNPEGLAEREALLGHATTLATEVTRRHAAVASLQREVDGRYVDAVTQANGALQRIADLNGAITTAESTGNSANDLRDQRRQALAELSGIVGVSAVEDARGVVTVSADNGLVLVTDARFVHPLAVRENGVGLDGLPLHEAGTVDVTGGFLAVPGAFDRGALAALAGVRDGELVDAASKLDDFALALRDQVNTIQTDPAAVDLDGNATTAAPIFAGTGAADLSVALTDPRRIGAALSAEPGDNQNALRLADLRDTSLAALGGVTFTDYLAVQQSLLGDDASRATDHAAANEALFQQLEAQRSSLSGVNLNEELTNLLQYQRAFQAASQVLGVANSVLDDLLNVVS